ncbi:hypothetical protein KFE25_001195 [Diacronema lutheri]|uniref:DUF1995 domain-containing protein n=1 Tax=Diacronema lutheri TaxID=2081491 RepID=A0A8J5X5M4_DIALT|nr:hypothetical protein KFE25_001195 [Diacronema lutheri]
MLAGAQLGVLALAVLARPTGRGAQRAPAPLRAVGAAGEPEAALPRSVVEISQQAALAALAALDNGHSRLQINLRSSEEPLAFGLSERAFSPLCEVLNSLAHVLASRGERVRLFFTSVQLAEHACRVINLEPLAGSILIDVLGIGRLTRDDDVCMLVTPFNTGCAADSHVLGGIQELLLQANKRTVVLINPELEAVAAASLSSRHRVRPMFMADFVHAFHFECGRRRASDGQPGLLALYRRYPRDWQVHRKEALAPWFTHVLSTRQLPRAGQLDALIYERQRLRLASADEDGGGERGAEVLDIDE